MGRKRGAGEAELWREGGGEREREREKETEIIIVTERSLPSI